MMSGMKNYLMKVVYALILLVGSPLFAGEYRVTLETRIVVAKDSVPEVKKAADDLATTLGRMTGVTPAVAEGDGSSGIVVGTAEQFPSLGLAEQLAITDLVSRERYVLRSHAKGVYVIGATAVAARHGVWDLLHRLGYRQFFPGAKWEVIPATPELKIDLDVIDEPDYVTRAIWYGYGLWDYNEEPYRAWCERNRTASIFRLSTGHAYGNIIHKNRKVFEEHPEYYGLIGGERKSTKMCIGNPELRQFVVAWAISQFEAKPEMDSISMDPSDGGGWCECERCVALGSISDRALTLANAVAEGVNERFKDKYVGMYAYAYHSPPPSIRVRTSETTPNRNSASFETPKSGSSDGRVTTRAPPSCWKRIRARPPGPAR